MLAPARALCRRARSKHSHMVDEAPGVSHDVVENLFELLHRLGGLADLFPRKVVVRCDKNRLLRHSRRLNIDRRDAIWMIKIAMAVLYCDGSHSRVLQHALPNLAVEKPEPDSVIRLSGLN